MRKESFRSEQQHHTFYKIFPSIKQALLSFSKDIKLYLTPIERFYFFLFILLILIEHSYCKKKKEKR